jgi:hypothetical protein
MYDNLTLRTEAWMMANPVVVLLFSFSLILVNILYVQFTKKENEWLIGFILFAAPECIFLLFLATNKIFIHDGMTYGFFLAIGWVFPHLLLVPAILITSLLAGFVMSRAERVVLRKLSIIVCGIIVIVGTLWTTSVLNVL